MGYGGYQMFLNRRRRVVQLPSALKSKKKSRASLVKRPALKPRTRTASRTALATPQRRRLTHTSVVQQTPGLTSKSYFKSYSKPSPRMRALKRVGAPNFYITNEGSQIIATEGFQNAFQTSWSDSADMKYIMARVPGAPGPGLTGTRRFALEGVQAEVLITNSSLAGCYVEIYDIARKRDANLSQSLFTAGPLNAWAQGTLDNQSAITVTGNYQDLKALPFDSVLFKDWFKVCKRTRLELSQGASHRHHVNLTPNKLIDESVIQYCDGDMAGITMYTMVVVYGQPASVPPEKPDDPTVVTTAKIALDLVTSVRYKYTWVSDANTSQYFVDNLSSLVGEQIASPGLGDIILNKIV